MVYLVFNEGYSASSGDALTRADLSGEAIRLGRLLVEPCCPSPRCWGLLALMLLHESRRAARSTIDGDLVLLEDQDRALWNRELIAEGTALVEQAPGRRASLAPTPSRRRSRRSTRRAPDVATTDWAQIVGLYDMLAAVPSPVIELNRAVAVAMRDGPAGGPGPDRRHPARGDLADYHLAHAVQADLVPSD